MFEDEQMLKKYINGKYHGAVKGKTNKANKLFFIYLPYPM